MRSLLVLSIAASLASASDFAAAQGANRDDREIVGTLDVYSAGVSADGLPKSVDLRPWLPEVGMQTMNDCAAWAFGYAGRSYLEAIDQGWKPDSPDRIFSPTFIYNQVNRGQDQGSRVDDVLALLMQNGAATLATAPYLANDHLTQPPSDAVKEAKTFKITDFGVLPERKWIRQALAEGYIVLCCVRTNPVFSSGRYDLYTKELHAKGHAARRPDQPHGFHAMSIVGYNDDREAFLFMNSWGKDWGDGGFVWVAYDVLDQFNQNGVEDELMDFAVVMFDKREPVTRVDGDYRILPLDELQVATLGMYSGYDSEAESGAYRYSASLRGAPALLERVREVRWAVPSVAGTTEVVSTNKANGFLVSGRSTSATSSIRATAVLDSGHTIELEATVEVPETQRRQLSLQRVDSFYESTDRADLWRWTLLPRMSDADWRDLTGIRYEVDELDSATTPSAYTHDGGLPPTWDLSSTAMPSFRTSQPLAGRAILSFRDGTKHELSFSADPFSDSVRRELQREVVWRPVGMDGNRHWYFYEIQIRYPEAWTDNIMAVRIGTGNNLDWQAHEAESVSGPGPRMHVFHGYARRPFASSASAIFRNEVPGLGRSTPVVDYDIHDFGPEASWTIPAVEDPNVLRAGHGFGIESRDRYLGEIDGQPTWEFEIWLEGTANINAVNQVTWRTPEGELHYVTDDGNPSNPDSYSGYLIQRESSQAFTMGIECALYNGETFELEHTVQPYAEASTALAVDLVDMTSHELEQLAPHRQLAEVRLLGLESDLQGIREVRCYAARDWGGVLGQQVHSWPFNLAPNSEQVLGRVEIERGAAEWFLLHYDDGSAVALPALAHSASPTPSLPRAQLLARERFAGWEDGQPKWEVDLQVRGQREFLAQVKDVEWTIIPTHNGQANVTASDSHFAAQLNCDGPTTAQATLHFRDELKWESAVIEAAIWTMSERRNGELRVRAETGWVPDLLEVYGPAVDPSMLEYAPTPTRLRIDGPPQRLAEIARVEWLSWDVYALEWAESDGEEPPSPSIFSAEADTRRAGFAWSTGMHPEESDLLVQARLHFKDGSLLDLPKLTLGYETTYEERADSGLAVELRPWGMHDGQMQTLVITRALSRSLLHNVIRAEPQFDSNLTAWRDRGMSFDNPTPISAALASESNRLLGHKALYREDGGLGYEEEFLDLDEDGSIQPLAESPSLGIHVESTNESGGTFHFLYARAHEELLARADAAVWHVSTASGQIHEYRVQDRIGERSDGFELRLHGPSRNAIELQLLDSNGEVIAQSTRNFSDE